MNALFKELLLRVFVSGVLCSLALILAGNGPHKEPVRLCCVALTLVVLIKPYSHNVPDIAAVLRSGEVISEMIESNVENANAQTCDAAINNVEDYLNGLIETEGFAGVVKLEYKLEENILHITRATIEGRLDPTAKKYVISLLKTQCGLGAESIFFREGIP